MTSGVRTRARGTTDRGTSIEGSERCASSNPLGMLTKGERKGRQERLRARAIVLAEHHRQKESPKAGRGGGKGLMPKWLEGDRERRGGLELDL